MKRIFAFIVIISTILCLFIACDNDKKDNAAKNDDKNDYISLKIFNDSMEPLFCSGDTIYIKKVDPNTIQLGDVIAFYDPAAPNHDWILTHRVIEIYEKEGIRYAITAGDNNVRWDYERDIRIADNESEVSHVESKVQVMKDNNLDNYEYIIYEGAKDPKPIALTEENIVGIYTYEKDIGNLLDVVKKGA
ncbi:MAG: signal peptidase I [Ruminococcaceae bacterium]|nr:signal peptidase I [Oscillospiraceae bacterium]